MSDQDNARSSVAPRAAQAAAGAEARKSHPGVLRDASDRSGEHEPEIHDQGHELGFELPPPAKFSGGKAMLGILIALAVLTAAFLASYLPRHHNEKELAESTHAAASEPARVETITAKRLDDARTANLPATVAPLNITSVYPRANGYIRRYLVDIGDHVKENQKIAEIETPEIDQQLDQARAQMLVAEARLAQATANRDLANTSLNRYKALRPAGVASQQELDQRAAQSLVDEANVKAAESSIAVERANMRRLQQLKAFADVLAPFSGIITARNVEPGALVSPTQSAPLFELTATDPVRVFVQVPQDLAPSVHVGLEAKVMVREYPSRAFTGTIARSAGSLDTQTRTMRTEVRVPNPDNALLTGMYAQVEMPLSKPHPVYELPATAVVQDQRGSRVGVVDEEGVLHMKPIVLERDNGATMQIASGVSAEDKIVRFINSTFSDGQKVSARPAKLEGPGGPPQATDKKDEKK